MSAMGLGNDVRADLEDRPRGPFGVDTGAALDAMRLEYDGIYDLGYAEGAYRAMRLTGGPVLSGATPDERAAAIRADWSGA